MNEGEYVGNKVGEKYNFLSFVFNNYKYWSLFYVSFWNLLIMMILIILIIYNGIKM